MPYRQEGFVSRSDIRQMKTPVAALDTLDIRTQGISTLRHQGISTLSDYEKEKGMRHTCKGMRHAYKGR